MVDIRNRSFYSNLVDTHCFELEGAKGAVGVMHEDLVNLKGDFGAPLRSSPSTEWSLMSLRARFSGIKR